MSAVLLDGKSVAKTLRADVRERADALRERGIAPCLAVIMVGDNPASAVYVKNKEKDCERCHIASRKLLPSADTTEDTLLDLIATLNADTDVHGILVQLPLPSHIDERRVLDAISPTKDVDAFHPTNVGRIVRGDYEFLPCTPAGVLALLDAYNIEVAGKECVIVGRSNIVGKPMALLLLHRHGTVTICHSRTPDLAAVCRRADILVAAVGKRGIITPDMVKRGAVVIDVAINTGDDGKLCGDCADDVAETAAYLTPVPGGVGPMTRAVLMQNTIKAAEAAVTGG